MDRIKIYSLIDSLSEIAHVSPEALPDLAIKGLDDFLKPAAAIIRFKTPQSEPIEKSVGSIRHRKILSTNIEKFILLNAASAEFTPAESSEHIIGCSQIKNLKGYVCILSTMIERDNPFRHLLRQILELYAGNTYLALTIEQLAKPPDIDQTIGGILPQLQKYGVRGLLVVYEAEPENGRWFDSGGSIKVSIPDNLWAMISTGEGKINDSAARDLGTIVAGAEEYKKFAAGGFYFGGRTIRCLFAGDFKRHEIIMSKFRSLLSEQDQPAGYEEISKAFQRLKDDHESIVKGERIAAILETTVAVNHEINNPLTAVLGNVQLLLLQKDKLPKDVVSKISTIEKSALRIREVTQKLLSIVEPITTSYADNLEMLDIDKSSSQESD